MRGEEMEEDSGVERLVEAVGEGVEVEVEGGVEGRWV